MKFPFFLTADLVPEGQSTRSSRVAIEVARCTSDGEREQFVRTLTSQGEEALREELREAPAVGSIQFDIRVPWILRYAREMPQDGGGTRVLLATERPITATAIWDDPRFVDYPFTVVDLVFDRHGAITGSLTLAARMTSDESGRFVTVENFASHTHTMTAIQMET